jgi:hypothetical protein
LINKQLNPHINISTGDIEQHLFFFDVTRIFLSGCLDIQTAADTVNSAKEPTGALTNALLDTWNTYGINIKFKHLLWDVRNLLKTRGYEQIPQLSSGNSFDINNKFKL